VHVPSLVQCEIYLSTSDLRNEPNWPHLNPRAQGKSTKVLRCETAGRAASSCFLNVTKDTPFVHMSLRKLSLPQRLETANVRKVVAPDDYLYSFLF
jgi:hypothetical protein